MTVLGALSAHSIGPVLDECRRHIKDFQLAPTAAGTKRNVRGGIEPVSEADRRVQQTLTEHFNALRPGIPVVGEEGRGDTLEELPTTCFVVDPIDGTVPFLSGSAYYAIAVCVVENGVPVEAVVDLPAFDFRVGRGQTGVYSVGSIDRLPDFGSKSVLASPAQIERVRARLAAWPGDVTVVPVPTATVKIVLAALGRAAAAVYLPAEGGGAAPWDYAAAALLCAALGGHAFDDAGRDLSSVLPVPINAWQASGPHSRNFLNLLS